MLSKPIQVAAISNGEYSYPPRVRWEIVQDSLETYLKAASLIGASEADLVVVQHEFGIFGGFDGEYVVEFLKAIRQPIITTFHSILPDPDDHHFEIVQDIGKLSSALVVMAQKGKDILVGKYGIPQWKIHMIHHGVPETGHALLQKAVAASTNDGFAFDLGNAPVMNKKSAAGKAGLTKRAGKVHLKPPTLSSFVSESGVIGAPTGAKGSTLEYSQVSAGASATVAAASSTPVGADRPSVGKSRPAPVRLFSDGLDESPDLIEELKRGLGLEGRQILTTFGLLSPSKGIEYALRAMPSVIERHPEVVYLVLGETHPVVKKLHGENYRRKLKKWVREMGIENRVSFINKYLTKDDLIAYLRITDIYITPYPNLEQISSGTLAYAVGMGKAVVSTPYLYAQELLDNGRGILVEPKNPGAISEAVNRILDNPSLRMNLEASALEYGRDMAWTKVGKRYLDVVEGILGVEAFGVSGQYDHHLTKSCASGRTRTK